MMMSFGFIAAYTVLIAIASVIEVPIARGFASVHLNLLIRIGSNHPYRRWSNAPRSWAELSPLPSKATAGAILCSGVLVGSPGFEPGASRSRTVVALGSR
jgi:hypothetical protein